MPEAYEWDYLRTDCDSNPLYDTFSVPVFQWIPKTRGKGLKRSKTIRVNGHTTVASLNTSENLPPSAGATNLPHEMPS